MVSVWINSLIHKIRINQLSFNELICFINSDTLDFLCIKLSRLLSSNVHTYVF